jgi:hypothetical protein
MVSAVGLSDDEVRERLVAAARAVDEAQVVLAGWVAEWERRGAWAADGSRNVSASVSIATGCSVITAREVLARGHALARMPLTRAAVYTGLSVDRVDLLARAATPERLVVFARDEAMLVAQVRAARVFADARRIVDYWCQAADDELGRGAPADPTGRVWLSRDQVTRRAVLDDQRAGVTRTAAQRRAVALVRMAARSASADGPTTRPLFEVVVGEEQMRRLCELSSGIVVRPDQLVDWADIAVFESFLFGDATTIISVSKQRTFRGALRRAIQVRDRRCQHGSGCEISGDRCDIDHRQPAAQGGPTSQFNASLGCRPHNRTIHRGIKPSPSPERTITRTDETRARQRWRIRRIRTDYFEEEAA